MKVKLQKGAIQSYIDWFITDSERCGTEITVKALKSWWNINVGSHVKGFHRFTTEIKKRQNNRGYGNET